MTNRHRSLLAVTSLVATSACFAPVARRAPGTDMVLPNGGVSSFAAGLVGKCLQSVPRFGQSSNLMVRECSADRPDSTLNPGLRGHTSPANP